MLSTQLNQREWKGDATQLTLQSFLVEQTQWIHLFAHDIRKMTLYDISVTAIELSDVD